MFERDGDVTTKFGSERIMALGQSPAAGFVSNSSALGADGEFARFSRLCDTIYSYKERVSTDLRL